MKDKSLVHIEENMHVTYASCWLTDGCVWSPITMSSMPLRLTKQFSDEDECCDFLSKIVAHEIDAARFGKKILPFFLLRRHLPVIVLSADQRAFFNLRRLERRTPTETGLLSLLQFLQPIPAVNFLRVFPWKRKSYDPPQLEHNNIGEDVSIVFGSDQFLLWRNNANLN